MKIKYDYINNNSDKLIIIFNSLTRVPSLLELKKDGLREEINDRSSFYNITKNENYNYLYIKDNFSDLYGWYLIDYGKIIIDEINEFITTFLKKNDYIADNVYTFGFSKGGTAALLYSLYNPNIGNCFAGTAQIDFETYLPLSKHEAIRTLIPYAKEMNAALRSIDKFTKTKINFITGIKEEQFREQCKYFTYLENNVPDEITFRYFVCINGYTHNNIAALNTVDIYTCLYDHLNNQPRTINDSFIYLDNAAAMKQAAITYQKNIILEHHDVLEYDKDKNILRIKTNNQVKAIVSLTSNNKLLKISKGCFEYELDQAFEGFIKFKYIYNDREKEVHKNTARINYFTKVEPSIAQKIKNKILLFSK